MQLSTVRHAGHDSVRAFEQPAVYVLLPQVVQVHRNSTSDDDTVALPDLGPDELKAGMVKRAGLLLLPTMSSSLLCLSSSATR